MFYLNDSIVPLRLWTLPVSGLIIQIVALAAYFLMLHEQLLFGLLFIALKKETCDSWVTSQWEELQAPKEGCQCQSFVLSPRQPVFPFVWDMKANIEGFKKCFLFLTWIQQADFTYILRLRMVILNAAIPKTWRLFRLFLYCSIISICDPRIAYQTCLWFNVDSDH